MEGCSYCEVDRRDLLNIAGRAARGRNLAERLIYVLGEGAVLEGRSSKICGPCVKIVDRFFEFKHNFLNIRSKQKQSVTPSGPTPKRRRLPYRPPCNEASRRSLKFLDHTLSKLNLLNCMIMYMRHSVYAYKKVGIHFNRTLYTYLIMGQ